MLFLLRARQRASSAPLLLLLVMLLLLLSSGRALASTAPADVGDVVTDISISDAIWTYAMAIVAPIIVGLLTKAGTSSKVAALLLVVVNTVVAVLTELGQHFLLSVLLFKLLTALTVSIAMHYGLLRPAGITGELNGVPGLARRLGVR